uniref:Uncharacterized protein n=1 Tax=Tanacetum cinerariifolium TaxID=118510 RepID=A0A6L2J3Q7_TANCI|nr:hypothetical protein [Tanacetum cinerariifolium]
MQKRERELDNMRSSWFIQILRSRFGTLSYEWFDQDCVSAVTGNKKKIVVSKLKLNSKAAKDQASKRTVDLKLNPKTLVKPKSNEAESSRLWSFHDYSYGVLHW